MEKSRTKILVYNERKVFNMKEKIMEHIKSVKNSTVNWCLQHPKEILAIGASIVIGCFLERESIYHRMEKAQSKGDLELQGTSGRYYSVREWMKKF